MLVYFVSAAGCHCFDLIYRFFVFFRCLAPGEFCKSYHNCIAKVNKVFQQYCQHFLVKSDKFKGVELEEFPQLEQYYHVQLYAMSLQEDGSAKTLYLSQSSHLAKIYMNVYENHLSFIRDVKEFPQKFICNCCGKLSTRMSDSK